MIDVKDLNQILEIENDSSVLEFVCEETNIPLYSLIRTHFLRMLISKAFPEDVELVGTNKNTNRITSLKNNLYSLFHNQFFAKSNFADILLTTTTVGAYYDRGLLKNRLSDGYYNAYNKTIILEEIKDWNRKFPEKNKDIIFHEPLKIEAKIRSINRKYDINHKTINDFVDLLSSHTSQKLDLVLNDDTKNFYKKLLFQLLKSLPISYKVYSKFFQEKGIKLVLGKTLSYGNSSFIAAAKDLNIKVTEYQHGIVSEGHDAYNFSNAIMSSENYLRCLPDHFLSYGKWWSKKMTVPFEIFDIGNPHRNEQYNKVKHHTNNNHSILVLGDGYNTSKYIDLVNRLGNVLSCNKYEVIFRPHPRERQLVNDLNVDKVIIDKNSNIYNSFLEAKYIISDFSTGLFESLGLVDRILVWSNKKTNFILPNHPFMEFKNMDELIEIINNDKVDNYDSKLINSIWEPNWKNNYLKYLKDNCNLF